MPNAASDHRKPLRQDRLLRNELRQHLLALPYRAFLQTAVHLLRSRGYAAVRPAGRDRWKGRNTAGGWDAEADLQAGALGRLRCIAQVKQFDTLAVAQRHVDELRGSCIRAGASQAILITLSTFSPVARRAAEASTFIAPVRLIDGEELLGLLIGNGIGVRRGSEGAWSLDERYFSLLKETSATGLKEESSAGGGRSQERRSLPHSVSISIRLSPPQSFPRAGVWQWEPDMNADDRNIDDRNISDAERS